MNYHIFAVASSDENDQYSLKIPIVYAAALIVDLTFIHLLITGVHLLLTGHLFTALTSFMPVFPCSLLYLTIAVRFLIFSHGGWGEK